MSFWRACAISARSRLYSLAFSNRTKSSLERQFPANYEILRLFISANETYPSTQQSFTETSPSNRARRNVAERPSYLRPRLFLELFDASMIRLGSNDCNNFHFSSFCLNRLTLSDIRWKFSVKDITSSLSGIFLGETLITKIFGDKTLGDSV